MGQVPQHSQCDVGQVPQHSQCDVGQLHIPFSPSLISLVVSVAFKHHVYLLIHNDWRVLDSLWPSTAGPT